MVSQEFEQLLALRGVDVALDELARNEESARARLESSRAGLEAGRESVKQDKKASDDLAKERKLLELELKQREEQSRKYNTQLYDVKTNKEYTALKEEIDKVRGESRGIEDRVLEMMVREDEIKGRVGRRNAELADLEKAHKTIEADVAAELAACEARRGELSASRREHAGRLSAPLLRRYEQIRGARGGSPLAAVIQAAGGETVCGACHVTVRPQLIVDIYKQEELVACESCGRILYLETQAAPTAPNA